MCRYTAWSGVVVGVLGAGQAVEQATHAGASPLVGAQTRNLIAIGLACGLALFVTGLGSLLRSAGRGDRPAALVNGAGLMLVTLTLVAASLEVGAALDGGGTQTGPVAGGAVVLGDVLLRGPVQRAVTAVFMLAAAAAILRSGALPRWSGHTAAGVAAVNLAFVPAVWLGADPGRFAGGPAGSLVTYWILAVGVTLLRRPAPVTCRRPAREASPAGAGRPSPSPRP